MYYLNIYKRCDDGTLSLLCSPKIIGDKSTFRSQADMLSIANICMTDPKGLEVVRNMKLLNSDEWLSLTKGISVVYENLGKEDQSVYADLSLFGDFVGIRRPNRDEMKRLHSFICESIHYSGLGDAYVKDYVENTLETVSKAVSNNLECYKENKSDLPYENACCWGLDWCAFNDEPVRDFRSFIEQEMKKYIGKLYYEKGLVERGKDRDKIYSSDWKEFYDKAYSSINKHGIYMYGADVFTIREEEKGYGDERKGYFYSKRYGKDRMHNVSVH